MAFGSVEYHGGHLPLGADAILADAVGAEVARRLGAVLAPTVRVGCSGRHGHLPGTVTLDPETLARLAAEYARALARPGFTLIVLLSAQGGNQPAMDTAVAEFGALLPGWPFAPRGGTSAPVPGPIPGPG
jgi:creatinine amidohydrolase